MDLYLGQQQSQLKIENNLFATSKYAAAGTTLLIQAPLASVPLPSERLHRCNYCLRKGILQCCSKCHSAYVCSNDCFLKSWIHFHRGLCQSPGYTGETNQALDVNQWLLDRAALTVYSHKSLTKKEGVTTVPTVIMDTFNSLEVHHQDTLVDQPLIHKTLSNISHIADYTTCELSKLWKRVQIASFPITDSNMHLEPIGIGIYPITSKYIRHSCRPNAGLIYDQGNQIIVALEDIQPNTPITISYVDLIATKQQRHKALTDRFGFAFECDCARCQGTYQGLDYLFELGESVQISTDELERSLTEQLKNWSVLDMIKEYAAKGFDFSLMSPSESALDVPHLAHFICRMIAPDLYMFALTNKTLKKSKAALYFNRLSPLPQLSYSRDEDDTRILPAVEALITRKSQSPFLTIESIKIAERVFTNLVTEGKWVEASRCSIYLYMVYRLVYPALYPKLVCHSLLLSKANWNSLVQLELAGIGKKLERTYEKGLQLWIEVAKISTSKIFGRESTLWREIIEIQWLFDRDQKLK
jgi:hypothetical protein